MRRPKTQSNEDSDISVFRLWVYYRFCLDYRDIEDLLAERGIVVSYESILHWCNKFVLAYANRLRRQAGSSGDNWFAYEVFVRIGGQRYHIFHVVDQDGGMGPIPV